MTASQRKAARLKRLRARERLLYRAYDRAEKEKRKAYQRWEDAAVELAAELPRPKPPASRASFATTVEVFKKLYPKEPDGLAGVDRGVDPVRLAGRKL